MGHEMVQRMWRKKGQWLKSMIQENPVIKNGCVEKAILLTAKRQTEELREIRQKILMYENNGSVAEKLTDTI